MACQIFLDHPDDSLEHIASFLKAPDLLQFLSTHPRLVQLSKTASFWRTLLRVDDNACTNTNTFECAQSARRAYLTKAYARALPSMEWKPVQASRRSPTGREGHLSCTLGDDKVVITGGFTQDPHVYVLDTTNEADWQKIRPTVLAQPWKHPDLPKGVQPQQQNPHQFRMGGGDHPSTFESAYGASLTALDDHRAIRFGGFLGGGYTNECHQLALLTLSPDGESASWQVIQPLGQAAPRAYHTATLLRNRYLVVIGGMTESGCIRGEAILDTQTWTWINNVEVTNPYQLPKPTGRHGHSVVLDQERDRFVLFGGGSGTDLLRSGTDNAEVWEFRMGPEWRTATTPEELITSLPWEWSLVSMNEDSDDDEEEESEENEEDDEMQDEDHHQAMVARIDNLEEIDADVEQGRGAGNDNNNTNDGDEELDDFQSAAEEDNDETEFASLPPLEGRAGDNNNNEEEEARKPPANHNNNAPQRNNNAQSRQPQRPRRLSNAEKLCLGRCHLGFHVGPDTYLLGFGSGHPSTNRLLGFNLRTNQFFRPALKGNVLPCPRFTATGVTFGPYNSYLLVHGGYCTQEGTAIGNLCVLDLAPALKREFTALPPNPDFVSSRPVTDDDIGRRGGPGFGFGHGMGIGGMEDLLQNMFFELAAGGGGGGRRVNGRTLGEMLGVLGVLGRGGGRQNNDEEDDSDEDDDDNEDDDNDDGVEIRVMGGGGGMRIVNMAFGGNIREVGAMEEDDDDDEDDEDYDDDMSEVS